MAIFPAEQARYGVETGGELDSTAADVTVELRAALNDTDFGGEVRASFRRRCCCCCCCCCRRRCHRRRCRHRRAAATARPPSCRCAARRSQGRRPRLPSGEQAQRGMG
ncbi:MAG: hypothetical protein ACK4ZJ_19540, partial [Allorhizobium sp.]